jgi:ribonuclease HI
VEFFAEIARQLWFRGNNVIHGGIFLHPNELIVLARSHIFDYKEAQVQVVLANESGGPVGSASLVINVLGGSDVTHGDVFWKSPPTGLYKVNWDVAINFSDGKMGYGGIVRDFMGTVQAAFCFSVDFVAEPVVAESFAALHTVEFCKNRGFTRIILEGDSLLVVQAINCKEGNWRMHGNIIADIQEGLSGFHSWKTCHTKRRANSAAHILAQRGCRYNVNRTWIGCIPDCIRGVVISEIPSLIL